MEAEDKETMVLEILRWKRNFRNKLMESKKKKKVEYAYAFILS